MPIEKSSEIQDLIKSIVSRRQAICSEQEVKYIDYEDQDNVLLKQFIELYEFLSQAGFAKGIEIIEEEIRGTEDNPVGISAFYEGDAKGKPGSRLIKVNQTFFEDQRFNLASLLLTLNHELFHALDMYLRAVHIEQKLKLYNQKLKEDLLYEEDSQKEIGYLYELIGDSSVIKTKVLLSTEVSNMSNKKLEDMVRKKDDRKTPEEKETIIAIKKLCNIPPNEDDVTREILPRIYEEMLSRKVIDRYSITSKEPKNSFAELAKYSDAKEIIKNTFMIFNKFLEEHIIDLQKESVNVEPLLNVKQTLDNYLSIETPTNSPRTDVSFRLSGDQFQQQM